MLTSYLLIIGILTKSFCVNVQPYGATSMTVDSLTHIIQNQLILTLKKKKDQNGIETLLTYNVCIL